MLRLRQEESRQMSLVDLLLPPEVLDRNKLRVDTTVVEANIHHPTDSRLIADTVRVVTRLVKQAQAAVGEAGYADPREVSPRPVPEKDSALPRSPVASPLPPAGRPL